MRTIGVTMLLLIPAFASAVESDRRGSFREIGLGASISTAAVVGIDPETQSGIEVGQLAPLACARLRLGRGLDDRWTAFACADMATSLDDRVFYTDALTFNILLAPGVRWNQKPGAPSWNVDAALGYAVMWMPGGVGDPFDNAHGIGAEIGAGLEFSPHWNAGVMVRRLDLEEGFVDRWAIDILFSHIGY